MDQRFANKVMVITGAAQGIGQRVAELAAQQGAKLALVDRSPWCRNCATASLPSPT